MLMRSFPAALGLAGLALISPAPADAADLGPYSRSRSYSSPTPYAYERWSGFYLGAGLGYASGDIGVDGSSGFFVMDQSGALGSLFAGYNWQMGGLVSGIEVDIGTGNVGGSYNNLGSLVQPDLNAIGSLRGRLGILATPQALLYATGGLAWANYDFKATAGNTVADTLVGYQIGAGLEYMLAPQWTMRLEYNFTDFGSARIDQGGVINTYDPDLHTVRAGIAYKF
jgi:outer membrane immunogenic protein